MIKQHYHLKKQLNNKKNRKEIIEITIEKLTIVEERDIGPKVNALEYRD